MYARTVTFDLNTDMWEEALAFGASVTYQIAGFPGLRSWVLVGNRETGKGTSFAVFENKQAFEAVNGEINEILAGFASISPQRQASSWVTCSHTLTTPN